MKPFYITITPFFPTPTNFRGPFVYDQIKAIEESGKYSVIVFKPKKWFSLEKGYEYEGVKVYRFKVFDLPSNILPGLFDFISIWCLKQKLRKIGIKAGNIAIAHAHVNSFGVFATALKNRNSFIKTIVQHHGFDVFGLENGIFSSKNWHRSWVKKYGIKISNAIDLHVGVSAKTLEFLTNYPEIKVKESYVLYNGVDTKKFYPITGAKDSNYFTIGCIGNFWPLKDQITLLKALKILIEKGMTKIRCKFIGSGVTLEDCQLFVIQNQLTKYVTFQSEVPHQELNNFYNTLNLFVLPSYHEAFGCVYTEAYACGVPFIAVEGQGIAELIAEKDQSNWLIKKEDYKGLAGLIREKSKGSTTQNLVQSVDIQYQINRFFLVREKTNYFNNL